MPSENGSMSVKDKVIIVTDAASGALRFITFLGSVLLRLPSVNGKPTVVASAA